MAAARFMCRLNNLWRECQHPDLSTIPFVDLKEGQLNKYTHILLVMNSNNIKKYGILSFLLHKIQSTTNIIFFSPFLLLCSRNC